MNFQPLKDFLDFYLPMLGVPGSDTVIYKDHEQIFRYQSGYDSLRFHTPVRSNALYHIYSISKISTAVAATQLIERGEILANDPVYAYLPEFKDMMVKHKLPNGDFELRPAKKPVLVKHLLTMTSGMDYNLSAPGILSAKERTLGRCPTLEMVRAMAKEPLCFEPGDEFQYSLSLDVVGGLVELVSGVSLSEYMQKNIFDVLGMENTSFDLTEDRLSRMATKYEYDPERRCAVEVPTDQNPYVFGPDYVSGGAGLISCVDDQILLADALSNGGVGKNGNRILSRYGVDLMRSNNLNQNMMDYLGANYAATGYGYGYGVRVNVNPGKEGNLAPVGQFGWDGAKLCVMGCDPENRIAFFHAEHMGGLHRVVIPRLRNIIYSCIGD